MLSLIASGFQVAERITQRVKAIQIRQQRDKYSEKFCLPKLAGCLAIDAVKSNSKPVNN
jgi:hypothetical protein